MRSRCMVFNFHYVLLQNDFQEVKISALLLSDSLLIHNILNSQQLCVENPAPSSWNQHVVLMY
jgi:hypothetical protein